jgi:hypothetical protein
MGILIIIAILSAATTFLYYRKKPVEYTPAIQYIPSPAVVPDPITPPSPPPMTPIPVSNQQKLYSAAKACIGRHMIITPGVPNLLGCASALSGVLKRAGYTSLPAQGIPGTQALNEFLADSEAFGVADGPEPGLIIMSPSGAPGATLEHGHVGVVGIHGICSNDSDTGEWLEKWTLQKWTDYYHTYGKLPIIYYRWLG